MGWLHSNHCFLFRSTQYKLPQRYVLKLFFSYGLLFRFSQLRTVHRREIDDDQTEYLCDEWRFQLNTRDVQPFVTTYTRFTAKFLRLLPHPWKLVWELQCHPWPVALVKFSVRILFGFDLKPECCSCGRVWHIHYQQSGVLPKNVTFISIIVKGTSMALGMF